MQHQLKKLWLRYDLSFPKPDMANQAQQHTPVILELQMLRLEDRGSKTTVSSYFVLLWQNTMTKCDLWKSLFWPTGPEWFHCGGEGMATGAGRWKLTSYPELEAERMGWEQGKAVYSQSPPLLAQSSSKPAALKLPQTVPPSGPHVQMSLWDTFLVQTTTARLDYIESLCPHLNPTPKAIDHL